MSCIPVHKGFQTKEAALRVLVSIV